MKIYTNGVYYYLTIHRRKKNLPTILCFHGFMGSQKVFDHLVQKINSFCNPVTIDLCGHGQTVAKPDPERFKTEVQVQDLISVLGRLQLDNLFLYGYSMGGRLALQLFLKDPSLFSGLIFESVHCGIRDHELRKQRQKIDEERAKQIETDFDSFLEKWIQLPMFQSPEGANQVNYLSILQNQNPKLMAASLRGFGAGVMPPVCDQLPSIKKPVGLIAGSSDQKYIDKIGEMGKLVQTSITQIIDRSGHRVHADQPESVSQFLIKYFDRYG